MDRIRIFAVFIFPLVVLSLCSCSGKMEGKSKNWKVTVISATKGKTPYGTTDAFEGYPLTLALQIEYMGPNAEVIAPTTIVQNDKVQKFKYTGNISLSPGSDLSSRGLQVINWLFSANRDHPGVLSMKTGERLGDPAPWLEFYFDIPKEPMEFYLIFDDVPPIRLNIKNS